MNYPLPGKTSDADRADRKATLIVLLLLASLGTAVWFWLAPEHRRVKTENAFLWRVAFTDDRITSHVGRVIDAHIEQEKSDSLRRPRSYDAHHRRTKGSAVIGDISFIVIGEEGAARAEIAYLWNHGSGEHSVTSISLKSIWISKQPNKAPEPTPGLVTPRALE